MRSLASFLVGDALGHESIEFQQESRADIIDLNFNLVVVILQERKRFEILGSREYSKRQC